MNHPIQSRIFQGLYEMHTERSVPYKWVVLAAGICVVFAALGLGRFGYSFVLPAMQEDLSITNTQTGALASVNLAAYLVLSLLGGVLAAQYGSRKVITTGLLIAGIGMFMTGKAWSYPSVAFWRGVTGIGSGASNVPLMGLLSSWFGRKQRGLATGIAASGSSVGLILLGPLVPSILTMYGTHAWIICWYILGIITLLIALFTGFVLRNNPSTAGKDEVADTNDRSRHSYTGVSLFHELKAVCRVPAAWYLGIVYIAFGFSYIIYMTFFFKHLVAEGGYTQKSAGSLLMLIGWLSLFCGTFWGYISDHIGRAPALAIIYFIQSVSFVLVSLLPTPSGFILSATLFGLTAWSIPAIMAAVCGDMFGAHLAPAALGFITVFFGIGQAAGPGIAGTIADAAGTFNPAFLLAGSVAFLGAAGSLFLLMRQ
jgi:MFS family permease